MTGIHRIGRYALFVAIFTSVTLLAACEDDPILQPNDGNDQGGSYGRIDIDQPDNSASKRAPGSVQADHEQNPALF